MVKTPSSKGVFAGYAAEHRSTATLYTRSGSTSRSLPLDSPECSLRAAVSHLPWTRRTLPPQAEPLLRPGSESTSRMSIEGSNRSAPPLAFSQNERKVPESPAVKIDQSLQTLRFPC